jgi:hypothetical protein
MTPCENCSAWKAEVERVRAIFQKHTDDGAEPFTADEIVAWLKDHRATHTDWASWFESHPDDPRIASVGTAEFHRGVERRYDRMIAGVLALAGRLRESDI